MSIESMPETVEDEARARIARGDALTSDEFAAVLRMHRSTFARHLAAGAFDKFRLAPQIGRPLFSGVLVQRYLAGDPLYVPTFGAKRGRR